MDNTEEQKEAPKKVHGNRKWTEATVLEEVQSILADIMANKSIIYLGEVYEERNYPRQYFSEWEKEYRSHSQISDTIKQIKAILESRINVGGLRNDLNAVMTKFNLVNNYGWKDRVENDNTIRNAEGETFKVDTVDLSPEVIDEHLQKYFQK